MTFDELCKSIMTAKEELLKNKIEANAVILNGRKYGKLIDGKYKPSIVGLAVEADNLPDDWDFIVQEIEPKPLTNADRIRAMTDEELEHFIDNCIHGALWKMQIGLPITTSEERLNWLKQEVDDDTEISKK